MIEQRLEERQVELRGRAAKTAQSGQVSYGFVQLPEPDLDLGNALVDNRVLGGHSQGLEIDLVRRLPVLFGFGLSDILAEDCEIGGPGLGYRSRLRGTGRFGLWTRIGAAVSQ